MMTDTLNKPVKDEVADERVATRHNQAATKYEKEAGIAGGGLFYGARNSKTVLPKPMSQFPTSTSLLGNQTHQNKLEPNNSNSTETMKNFSSSSSCLSSNSSLPARLLRPSTVGHIPLGPAAAAISAGIGPIRFPMGSLPMHSPSTTSKIAVLNSGSSAFVPHSPQHYSSTNPSSAAFSVTEVGSSRPTSSGLTVNSSLIVSSSQPLHSVMTSALNTVAVTTSSSVPRLTEVAPSKPSFPSIHSSGGAFQVPSTGMPAISELTTGPLVPPFGSNFNSGATRVISSNAVSSAMSAGSLVVRQPQKPLVVFHSAVSTAVCNASSSNCSTSVVSMSDRAGLKSVTMGISSSEAAVADTVSSDIRAHSLSSSSFLSPAMSSATVLSTLPMSSHDQRHEKSENPLAVSKFAVTGLDMPGVQSGGAANSTNVVFAYPGLPGSFQSPNTMMNPSSSSSRSTASVAATVGNPVMMSPVSGDKQTGLSLLGHCFLSGSSGVSCTGSTGNLAVIGGGHQQSGLMTVGQQLQQQKQQPSGTMGGPGFGLVTRATNTGSQTVCISPSASPRPAPTILRKRPAEGHRKLDMQSPDCRLSKSAGSVSSNTVATDKQGLVDGFLLEKIHTSVPGKLIAGGATTFPILTPSTASSLLTSALKQTSDDTSQAHAVSLLSHLQNAAISVKQSNAFGSFASLDLSALAPEIGKGSADGISPRKKPRKQHFTATDDQYASNVPLDEVEDNCKRADEEDELPHKQPKYRASNGHSGSLGMTKASLDYGIYCRQSQLAGYRLKAPHNHFLMYSDVRRREERTLALSEICSQRGINKQVSGWKLVRFSRQLDELADIEDEVRDMTTTFQTQLPSPTESRVTPPEESEVAVLAELVQGDVERSKVVIDQMHDVKLAVKLLLDHSTHIGEVLQKHTTRKPLPFSRRSKPEHL